MKKIILASGSPRRRQILAEMGLTFEIIKSPFVEEFDHSHFSYQEIERLAFGKARAVANNINEDCLVIGADTVVVLDDKVLGKPKDFNEAKLMLETLSGKRHFVVTSICVIDTKTNTTKIDSTTSYVEFNKLSDEIITSYINDFKPYDKAGSYGIQELPSGFAKNVDGSFDNIIGLSSDSLSKLLQEF